jgi:probable phosphoglycerate mutase
MSMRTVTRILVLRHGESEWNVRGKWQGQADPPLTDTGREQAWLAAGKLGTFDVIACSDLQRARETAEIVARGLGHEVHAVHPEFRETHVGEWEGLTRVEIDRDWPDYLARGLRPPGFEPDESIVSRFTAGLGAVAGMCPGGTALVVAHGGVIRVMRRTLSLSDPRIPNLGGCEFTLATGAGGASISAGEVVELVDHGDIAESL